MRSLAVMTTLATASFFSTTSAAGLGLNCKGSFRCKAAADDVSFLIADYLHGLVEEGFADRLYHNGELIACHGSICAFLQRTPGGLTGREIMRLADILWTFNCLTCGSVPIEWPTGNNCDYGMLTFNFVYGCNDCLYDDNTGLCPPNPGAKLGGKWTWKCYNNHEPWKWPDDVPPPEYHHPLPPNHEDAPEGMDVINSRSMINTNGTVQRYPHQEEKPATMNRASSKRLGFAQRRNSTIF